MKKHRSYDVDDVCPVEATSDVVGGKWKSVIIFHLLSRSIRFNELRRLLPGVSQRILTRQLRELESDGVVHRQVYPEVPPRVEYSLTEIGRSLEPVVISMRLWGTHHAALIFEARQNPLLSSQ